jgi:hypothetical protein
MSALARTGLVVVRARDEVNRVLANHDGRKYTSPPQQRSDALALVALLLERPVQPHEHEQASWTRPVAGGHRTITIDPLPAPPKPTGHSATVIPAASRRPGLGNGAAAATRTRPSDGHVTRRQDA